MEQKFKLDQKVYVIVEEAADRYLVVEERIIRSIERMGNVVYNFNDRSDERIMDEEIYEKAEVAAAICLKNNDIIYNNSITSVDNRRKEINHHINNVVFGKSLE